MPLPKKTKRPRLLPELELIKADNPLALDDFTTHYRCRCGNTAETGIRLEAVTCIRCGAAMKPVA